MIKMNGNGDGLHFKHEVAGTPVMTYAHGVGATTTLIDEYGAWAGATNSVLKSGDAMAGALTMNNAGLNMSGANGDIVFDNAGGTLTLAGGGITDSAGNINLKKSVRIDADADVSGVIFIDSGLANGYYSAIDFYDRGIGKWGMGKNMDNDFYVLEMGLADRLTIKKTTGYVGIGTTGPSSALQVVGTVTATAFDGDGSALTNISAGTHNHDAAYVNVGGDAMTGALTMNNVGLNMNGVNGDIAFNNAGGNITLAGGAISDIAGDVNIKKSVRIDADADVNGVIFIDSGLANGYYSAIDFYDRGIGKWGMGKNIDNDFYVQELGVADRLTIKKTSGYVGIGTTGPSSALQVAGTVTATAFDGDGSALTNIAAGTHNHDASYVNVGGDTMSGQLTSTVADGTAPFVVTSTTKVTNLNADALDGLDSTEFMAATTDNWVDAGGDTMTGALTMNNVGLNMNGVNGDIAFNNAGGNITLAGGAISDSAGDVNINDGLDVNGTIQSSLPINSVVLQHDAPGRMALRMTDSTESVISWSPTGMNFGWNVWEDGASWQNGNGVSPSANLRVSKGTIGTDRALEFMAALSGTPQFHSKLAITYAGKVGLGTATPSYNLHLKTGDESSVINIDSGSGSAQLSELMFSDRGTPKWSILKDTTNGFDITEESVAMGRLHILPGGNVGLGTTSPANKLDVEGSMAVGATYSGASAAPANGLIVEGSVGIGTTNPGAAVLDVTASAANGDNAINVSHAGSGSGTTAAIRVTTTNTAHGIDARTTGTAGRAGKFMIENAANNNDVLFLSTAYTGGGATLGRLIDTNKGAYLTNEGAWVGTGGSFTGDVVVTGGSVSVTGAITAGCPTGTVSAGDFCIDNANRGFANWRTAVNTCRGAGMHLCSAAELHAGCQAGGIGFSVAPTMYYISDVSPQNGHAGNYSNTSSGCAADPVLGDTIFSTTYPYYCCRGK
jgi:hypothetical protein